MARKNDRTNRDSKGRFASGNPGGPGRKPGVPSKVARLVREKWEDQAEQVAQVVLEQALEGDLEAARIVLERLYPKPKDSPVSLDLPEDGTLIEQAQAVIQAVGNGQITPSEGQVLSGILSNHARVQELEEVKAQLQSLQRALDHRMKEQRENEKLSG